MSMFKVGDKVVRKERCGEDEYFISKLGGSPYYIVTSVSDGGRFIQVDGIITRSDKHPWYVNNFELYQEPEDEAHNAFCKAAREYHGSFYNPG